MKKARANKLVTLAFNVKNLNTSSHDHYEVINVIQSENSVDLFKKSTSGVDFNPNENTEEKDLDNCGKRNIIFIPNSYKINKLIQN